MAGEKSVSEQLLESMKELTKSNKEMISKFEGLEETMKENDGKVDSHITVFEQFKLDTNGALDSLTARLDSAEKLL